MAAHCPSRLPHWRQASAYLHYFRTGTYPTASVLLSTCSKKHTSGHNTSSQQLHRHHQQQQQLLLRRVLLAAVPHDKAATARHQSTTHNQWMPPEAWICAVASGLPTVDVDSLPAYTELLQECLVLQPALLLQHPRQAAASLLHLERCLRGSAVWLGPRMVAEVLTRYNPDTLAVHLAGLMEAWLTAGGLPHGFGQLWLEAPHALLTWNGPTFAAHLQELQQQVPDIPVAHLLNNSGSIAGVLLSLDRAQQLEGCVHRAGGYLIITPYLTQISIRKELDVPSSGADRHVVAIYGCYQPQVHREVPSGSSAHGSSSSGTDDDAQGTPGSGQAEPGCAGGVYGWQQTLQAAETPTQQQQQQHQSRSEDHSSTRSTALLTSQTWKGLYGQSQRGDAASKQSAQQLASSSSEAQPDWSQPMLLMQLDVRPPGVGLMPVLILPPKHAL